MTRAFATTLVGFPGNDDRDAKRIAAAANAMRLTRIDHVVISHWHGDHVGGLSALAKLLPLGEFYDHGDGVEPSDRPLYEGYKAIAGTRRHIVTPGETIILGDVRVRVLVAAGAHQPVHDQPAWAGRDGGAVRAELVSPARQAARHRGHLARAPVIARRRRCPQHLARHDRQPGGGSRRPGAHDHRNRVGRRRFPR